MPPQPEGYTPVALQTGYNPIQPLTDSDDDDWVDDRRQPPESAPLNTSEPDEAGSATDETVPQSEGTWRGLLNRFRRSPVYEGLHSSDGVFGNLVAKDDAQSPAGQSGEAPGYVEDDAQPNDEPPTYEEASADATPSYWETTIMTSDWGEEVIVGDLPVGSFLHFAWNMLISVAFSYIGFFITYLFHTSHAAKGGSIAGFGATLIQSSYGLRSAGTVAPGAPPSEFTPSDPNSFEDGPPIGYVMHPTGQNASQEAQPEESNVIGLLVFIAGCVFVIKGVMDYASARYIQSKLLRQQEIATSEARANREAAGEPTEPAAPATPATPAAPATPAPPATPATPEAPTTPATPAIPAASV